MINRDGHFCDPPIDHLQRLLLKISTSVIRDFIFYKGNVQRLKVGIRKERRAGGVLQYSGVCMRARRRILLALLYIDSIYTIYIYLYISWNSYYTDQGT
jgi:hypothetical protein